MAPLLSLTKDVRMWAIASLLVIDSKLSLQLLCRSSREVGIQIDDIEIKFPAKIALYLGQFSSRANDSLNHKTMAYDSKQNFFNVYNKRLIFNYFVVSETVNRHNTNINTENI